MTVLLIISGSCLCFDDKWSIGIFAVAAVSFHSAAEYRQETLEELPVCHLCAGTSSNEQPIPSMVLFMGAVRELEGNCSLLTGLVWGPECQSLIAVCIGVVTNLRFRIAFDQFDF
jgi:hypothetical protein